MNTVPPNSSGEVRAAVATICFDGFGDEGFDPAFSGIPELGIFDVEFNCWYPRTLTAGGLEDIVRRCETIGARPVSLQVISPAPASSFGGLSADVARWMWLMEAAERIGAGTIKTTGTSRDTDGEILGRTIDVLRFVAPIAADRGITVAIENHFQNTFEFPGDYDRLFEEVPEESVGMCLDTGHFAASGVDMYGLIDRFGSRIVHIDLKDCAQEGSADFVPFGNGMVDFDGVLSHAVNNGYTGHLVVEYPLADKTRMHDQLRVGADIARRHTTS